MVMDPDALGYNYGYMSQTARYRFDFASIVVDWALTGGTLHLYGKFVCMCSRLPQGTRFARLTALVPLTAAVALLKTAQDTAGAPLPPLLPAEGSLSLPMPRGFIGMAMRWKNDRDAARIAKEEARLNFSSGRWE